MSAFTRELPDSGWYRGLKIPASVLRNIDEKTKKAVSGTGGAYSPSQPIIIGGEGIELQCGVLLAGGAHVVPAAGKAIRFGDDDYFVHGTPQVRTIDQCPMEFWPSGLGIPAHARIYLDSTIATVPAIRTVRADAFLRLPLRIPDGAILTAFSIDFKVGQTHANVPTTLPSARVIRVAADGTIDQYPSPTTVQREPGGWVSPALPASGALWYAAGALQTLTLTFSAAGVPTDTSQYAYAVEWREESGADSFTNYVGNYLVHFRFTVRQPDLRPY